MINPTFNQSSPEGGDLRVLLVEDEARVADFVSQALRESGYAVDWSQSGNEGSRKLCSGDYDVAILDLMLPDMDGIAVLEYVREKGISTPVLLLTARSGLDEKVRGLDAGADDYLGKPFDLAELLARIRALLRRKYADMTKLQLDTLLVEPDTRRVTRGGKRIDLSAREFALLEYLLRNKGRVLLKSLILERVWEDPFARETNIVEVYINYLRSKIERPESPRLIHTVRGVGYVMEVREDTDPES